MVIARAADTRTTATAPRPGADASATIVSSPPGSDAADSAAGRMARYVRAGTCTTGPDPFFRSWLISHCCGSEARFCTK